MKTLIAIPCMDMMHSAFVRCLCRMRKIGDVEYGIISGSLIYDARNELAGRAVEENFDFVLWLDSDMVFNPDLMERLLEDMEDRQMVSGIYYKRVPLHTPVIYKECRINRTPEGRLEPVADIYMNYPEHEIFPIKACGFGCVMMRAGLIASLQNNLGPWPFMPAAGFGEDLSFCMRVHQLGETIYADSNIQLGHIGQRIFGETENLSLDNK